MQSSDDPFEDRETVLHGVRVLTRAEAMGIVGGAGIEQLEAPAWQDALARIRRVGVGRHLGARAFSTRGGRDEFLRQLILLEEALEASPVPAFEGPKLDTLLGRDLLARLLRISAVSLRRYLSGTRTMPDLVAARLHFLALVCGDLAGAYNDVGVRRWFDRRRTLLGDRTPAELLGSGWQPEDAGPRQVRSLAGALVWSPAT